MRHSDAHEIWNGGACNPRAVARALVRAIDEACEEGNGHDAAKDPAVQMIIDHLAYLCGLPQPSITIGLGDWDKIMTEVESKLTKTTH